MWVGSRIVAYTKRPQTDTDVFVEERQRARFHIAASRFHYGSSST